MTPVPFTVHADLAHGLATAHPWGLGLDGILAAQLWQQLLDHTDPHHVPWPSTTPNPPDLPLPLARCDGDGHDAWHWAATCSWTEPGARREVHHRYQPSPAALFETLAGDQLPGTIAPGTRFARREVPELVTVAGRVTWRGVGDPDRVQELLDPVTAIGKGRQHGEGRVLRWTVIPDPDGDVWQWGHLHPDGSVGRPCPEACLPSQMCHSNTPMMAGLRPPVMHPSRQHLVFTPSPMSA